MRAGRLRHRVEIQTLGETRDPAGDVVPAWTTDATVWAGIEPLRGRELVTAERIEGRTPIRVRMRHYPGLTSANRLLFGSRELNIDSVASIRETDREMEVMCWETS